MIVKAILTISRHNMPRYLNHMINIEIEQKKEEEPTLERMGGFMG